MQHEKEIEALRSFPLPQFVRAPVDPGQEEEGGLNRDYKVEWERLLTQNAQAQAKCQILEEEVRKKKERPDV